MPKLDHPSGPPIDLDQAAELYPLLKQSADSLAGSCQSYTKRDSSFWQNYTSLFQHLVPSSSAPCPLYSSLFLLNNLARAGQGRAAPQRPSIAPYPQQ